MAVPDREEHIFIPCEKAKKLVSEAEAELSGAAGPGRRGLRRGGYGTFIFDKYSEALTERFVEGSLERGGILRAEAVRGTQEAEWEGRTLFLAFDIRYELSGGGFRTERARFVGQRTWFDTYDWSRAIAER